MCGIFGMSTNKPENLDVNGVHILGIYNIERGKMSCGLSWDGDVQYGLGLDKLYTDFIIDRKIKPVKIPIIIGHTRQPSYGFTVTEDNAHPFGFGTSKDNESYEMIFCHNGTLKNHKELAKKYDIDLTEKITKISHAGHEYEITRDKIDSEILGEILYKTKKFHVLSEYIGAAALAWTWIDEPNKLYLWSGASKQTEGSLIPTEFEERPMNVYCKNQNSMFFSSLKDSLVVLGALKKDELQIDYNTVYIITDGDFANAEKHKASRLQAGQSEKVLYNTQYDTRYNKHTFGYDSYCDWEDVRSQNLDKISTNVNTLEKSTINLQNDTLIYPIDQYKNKVYSKSLRYWEKDSLINGIYIYIKNWGFKFAGIDTFTAENYIRIIKGLTFDYKEGGFVSNVNAQYGIGFIPFKKDVENIQFHYFTNGVLLKTLEDYNRSVILNKNLKHPVKYINYQVLSYISKHPVIDMNPINTSSVAMLDGKSFTGNITELGFEKIYYFNNGIFVKWVRREDLTTKIETPVIVLPRVVESRVFDKDLFDNSVKSIVNFEKDITSFFDSEIINKELEDESFINELILETFQKHSEEVDETIIELSDWKNNENVKTAINTLNLINHTLKDFVEKPNKK